MFGFIKKMFIMVTASIGLSVVNPLTCFNEKSIMQNKTRNNNKY